MIHAEDTASDNAWPVEFLSVGDIGVDVMASVDHLPSPGEKLWVEAASSYPGGMAANAAAVYSALGGTAGIVGRVGPDGHGIDSLADLAARGVDTRYVEQVTDPTFWTVALSTPGGERSLIQFETPALWPQPAPGDIDTMIEATAIHTMAEQGDHVLPLLRAAADSPAITSIDIESPAVYQKALARLVSLADVAFVNTEAALVLGSTPERAAHAVRAMGPATVCVTLGADGALLLARDGSTIRVRAHEVEVVDVNGAGDSFAAAFTWARVRDWSDREAVELANAVAAVSTTAPGRSAVINGDSLHALLDRRGIAWSGDAQPGDAQPGDAQPGDAQR